MNEKFKLADMRDLEQIKSMYQTIIKQMEKHKISIWDDTYPCEFFEEDIKRRRLYLMADDREIIAAAALCDSNSGEDAIEWENSSRKSLYLDRLGVNVNYLKKGIGSRMLTEVKAAARDLGAEYLRLFVVDINIPAIKLYEKNGFSRAKGVFHEVIDKDYRLDEYGYEIKLSNN